MAVPELDELAKVLPERAPDGRFYWQPFVDRIEKRFDGLPAPDGGESFVQGCVAAGCQAVPVIRRNTLWENQAPPLSERRARGVFELRIRLGLFFAASLRYLVHGACRLRIKIDNVEWHPGLGGLKAGGVEWHPVTGDGVSFGKLLTGHAGAEPVVTWSEAAPGIGEVCVLAGFFFPSQEVVLLTPGLAGDVLAYRAAGSPDRGLFGRMLGAEGQVEDARRWTSPAVFLEGTGAGVCDDKGIVRVNTRANGHVFITPEFWLLTTPSWVRIEVQEYSAQVGSRKRRYDLPSAMRYLNALVFVRGTWSACAKKVDKGNAVRVYVVDVCGVG